VLERHARETDGNVGVCVQVNLKRTGETLERLADCPGTVRLVKGAYDPPAEIAYKEKSKVDEIYREYLTYMFEQFDDGIAVGSHDPAMSRLTGVREEAQFALRAVVARGQVASLRLF
jgi:proline dehydrogenase